MKIKNRIFEQQAVNHALAFIAPTTFAGNVSKELFHIKNKTVKTIHYGVDLAKFNNEDPQNFDSFSILYLGTLIRKKGVLELPDIFEKVQQKYPKATLLLIGSDSADIKTGSTSTWALIQQRIEEKNLSGVQYLGKMPYSEVKKYVDLPTIPITDENKIVEILVKWWEKKYGMIAGERNNNAYILAAAFNDFGVNENLAKYIMTSFASKSFPNSEVMRTIKSAYSQKQNFGTKFYEDEEKVNLIKHKLLSGVTKKEIRSQLADDNIEVNVIESVINKLEEEHNNNIFWSKNEKGTIKIVHILFKNFLEDNGFYKFNPEGSKNYVFVRVTNNLIDHTSEKEIKDFILNYLLEVIDVVDSKELNLELNNANSGCLISSNSKTSTNKYIIMPMR